MRERFGRRIFDVLRLAIVTAIVVAGVAAPTGRAAAQAPSNIVLNGGFDDTPVTAKSGQQDLIFPNSEPAGFAWKVDPDSIALIGSFWTAADGPRSISLNGRGAGKISQTVNALPGRSYLLRFKYSAHPDRLPTDPPTLMTVRWGAVGGTPSLQEQFPFSGHSTKTDMAWITVERFVQATADSMGLSFTSDTSGGQGMALDSVSLTLLPLAAPALIRVVPLSEGSTGLIGRVEGVANPTLKVYAGTTCSAGGSGEIGTVSITTDTDPRYLGYFAVSIPATSPIALGSLVSVRIVSPDGSGMSNCLVKSVANDSWPNALDLDDASIAADYIAASKYIDAPGRPRWYKFKVLPGQRIQAALSTLPADYDIALFKDIRATFLSLLGLTGTKDLTRLTAEYAPSAFSPSAFSPSAFSPSAFSPDAYAPSAFSPSAFSSDVYSPSAFSPSAFSPSAFSPSAFSPSAFSPSAFSPSAFSPSAFSAFGDAELAAAFSSAQTRSIIAVSATPGLGDELAVANSWSNTGYFYARVSGRSGAYSTASPFQLAVAKGPTGCPANADGTSALDATPATRTGPAPSGFETLILVDSSKTDTTTLGAKLATLALRTSGFVVDVNADTLPHGAVSKRGQADANKACPYAKNLLAEEIKSIVDWYRTSNTGLKYIVIVGNDGAIPFFRYPDQALLGPESNYFPPVLDASASNASLRNDYVLSQDAYGSGTQVSLRTNNYPVPGLAVGRLVETPAEIAGLIDAYLTNDSYINNGVVSPGSSLVTGYDFLADAADAVTTHLAAGTGQPSDRLVTANGTRPDDPASWSAYKLSASDTRPNLKDKLLGSRHDVIFLAGHFSANSALAADFTTSLLTTDLAASTVDLKNAVIFSAGCHSGYNILDDLDEQWVGVTQPLDWAQAFARKKATLIAGTGYQYGDTDFIEYSERIYANFARQLRTGTDPVAVGEALVKAKLDYLAATPDVRGIHEKALLEATLFGLPMLKVNMLSAARLDPAIPSVMPESISDVATGPGSTTGLKVASLTVNPNVTLKTQPLKDTAGNLLPNSRTYYFGPEGAVVANPAEPVLPLNIVNVTPPQGTDRLVLRGVGFEGGTSTNTPGVYALTDAATMELRGVHVPVVTPVFFPMKPWTVNYWGALADPGNGRTSLHVTAVQHRAEDIAQGTSMRRVYSNLALKLYYSNKLVAGAADPNKGPLSDAPSFVGVTALPVGSQIEFTAQVVGDPAAGIQDVWVTYTGDPDGVGSRTWTSKHLTQCNAVDATTASAGCVFEDSRVWKGRIATVANIGYMVQAVNAYGVVATDDDFGALFRLAGLTKAATSVAINSVQVQTAPGTWTDATGAKYGETVRVNATLSPALANQNVIVTIGGAARAGLTSATGTVTVDVPMVVVPGAYKVVASFAGTADLQPSAASTSTFTVAKAPTRLLPVALPSGVTRLCADLGVTNCQDPINFSLIQESVKFTVTGGSLTEPKVFFGITDYLGWAKFAPTGFAPGTYSVSASFAGNTTYEGATSTAQSLTLAPQNPISFPGLPASIVYPGTSTFTVSSQSEQPVTVTLSPNPSPACTLSGPDSQGVYTLTATAAGICTIVATAGGTTVYADVTTTSAVAITGVITVTATVTPSTIAFGSDTSTYPAYSVSMSPDPAGCASTPVTLGYSGQPSVSPAPAGSYTIAPAVTSSVSPQCTVNKTTATLTVNRGSVGVQATVSQSSMTYGDDVDPGKITVTPGWVGPSGTLACLTSPLAVTLSPLPSTTPIPVGNYAVTPTITSSVSSSCDVTNANAPFSVSQAPSAFSSYAATQGAPGSSTVTITGNLTRAGKLSVYPTSADLAGNAFTIAVKKGTTTVATRNPSSLGSNGYFSISDITLPFDAYTVTFNYTGSTNFLAVPAPGATVSLRVEGFENTANMIQPRSNHSSTLLNDGRVLIAGGFDATGAITATSEVYCPSPYAPPPGKTLAQVCPNGDGKFSPMGNLPSKSAAHSATLLPTGKVLVVGGGNSSAEVFDPATGQWTAAGGVSVRSYHTATLLNGKVFIAGGSDNSGKAQATTIIYDPATGTNVSGPTLLAARERHTATLLANGTVLIVGGRQKSGTGYVPLSSAEIYVPPALGASGVGTVSAAPSMLKYPTTPAVPDPRFSHTAVRLSDGRVLVAGGSSDTSGTVASSLATAQLYGNGTWSTTAPPLMQQARREFTLTMLGDGRVLATAGVTATSTRLANSELFSLSPDAFTLGASLAPLATTSPTNPSRSGHAATRVNDGRVLVTGGTGASGVAINSAEIYNGP